jgi:hypothetical protein
MDTIRRPPITARQALVVILCIAALAGISGGHYLASRSGEPLALAYLSSLLLSFYIFLWYCRDRDARGERPSRWLSVFMVSLTVVAVPYYVWHSRPRGQKLRAFARLLGFVFLCVLAEIAGTIAGALFFP